MSDDEEYMQRQVVRYTSQAMKRYLEAHLAIKVEEEVNKDLRRDGCSPNPLHPQYKPHRVEPEQVKMESFDLSLVIMKASDLSMVTKKESNCFLWQVSDQIFTLLELMNYRSRWDPVDRLIKLGGITTLLQVRSSS